MVLVVSSIGNVKCTNLNVDGLEFFSQSSSLNKNFFNSYLEARDIDCTIPSALDTILIQGSFPKTNVLMPLWLSVSVIL